METFGPLLRVIPMIRDQGKLVESDTSEFVRLAEIESLTLGEDDNTVLRFRSGRKLYVSDTLEDVLTALAPKKEGR